MATRGGAQVHQSRSAYNHLCLFHVDTLHGREQDKLEEFSEITGIGWTVVDFKRKKDIVYSEEIEMTLTKVLGEDGLEYTCVTPDTFTTATQMVAQSIKELGEEVRCALVCEDHITLRHYLHRKARQKGVELDPLFFSFFHLQKEFKKTFAKTPGNSPEEMAKSLNITLPSSCKMEDDRDEEGDGDREDIVTSTTSTSEESSLKGIERQGVLAAVVIYLARMGHIFIEPYVIHHRWDFDPRAVPVPKSLHNSLVVGAQGVDYNLQYSDLLDFFAGLNAVSGGLVICINKNGQKNGQATIVFEDKHQAELALLRNRHHLQNHGRYLNVKRATANEFLQQIYGTCRPLTSSPFIRRVACRIKFLPPDTSQEDLIRWLRPLKPAGDKKGILLLKGNRSDKKPINEALVAFRSFDDMYQALESKKVELKGQQLLAQPVLVTELIMLLRKALKNHNIHPFCLEMFQGSMERILLRFQLEDGQRQLKVQGLSTRLSGRDILKLFEHLGEEIEKGGMRTVLDGKGRFTGECVVLMKTAMAAYLAANKLMDTDRHVKVKRTEPS